MFVRMQLVIEVANTSLGFDLKTKANLYARGGIADYWVLDITGRRMIVHRIPQNGVYTPAIVYAANESVAPLAAPQSSLRISDAFPA
jgi:Uma2 family endonuclease